MKKNYALLLIALVGYILIGYAIPRASFVAFIMVYLGLFGSYFYWCNKAKKNYQEQDWTSYLAAAILCRFIFLFAYPELSDDFWRYLWDGRLLNRGINPYQFLPSDLLGQPVFEQANLTQIYEYLNSPNYYSVYPPLTQVIFTIATFSFEDSVWASLVFLRLIVISFDIGTIILLIKVLRLLKKPTYLALFYAFNPLVIIELTGNLHTEGTMIFFLVLALYFILKNQLNWSAVSFSMAVGAKLLPLMFMPLILHRLWFKKGFLYCAIVGVLSLFPFLFFFDLELIDKIRTSMALYFAHFEFNASIYYVIRYGVINEYWWVWEYHDSFRGNLYIESFLRKDLYGLFRTILPIVDIILILILSIRKSVRTSLGGYLRGFLFIYTTHFFFSTTIHPWYLTTLVMFGVLTAYRYTLLWSCLAGLSYISYIGGSFAENYYLIGLEYVLVFGMLTWELYTERKLAKEASLPE
jgi:alpha-1,6-mannosyltransferase